MTQLTLKHPALLKDKAYVNGAWIGAASGETFAVTDPATDAHIADVPNMDASDCKAAIATAHDAFQSWKQTTAQHRGTLLKDWARAMLAHSEDLAHIMTLEQGKPLAEARGEVGYAASFLEWFGEEARRNYGEVIPSHLPNQRMITYRQPVGVAASITPWNFPAAMITRKAGAALAAGCTMVAKPAEQTPLSAFALAQLAHEVGIPAGVFNVITGDPASIGGELTSSEKIAKITFTGSTAVGRLLLRQSADTVKKVSLELGGNAPFIVFDDADIDAAVAGAMASKFRNAGQTCVCSNRIYVQAGVYDAFAEKLAAATAALNVANGFDAEAQQGPLIDDEAVAKVREHIGDAVSAGARVITGGEGHSLGGRFFQPTVLADVTPGMIITREETFGPVAPLIKFEEESDVIAQANQTEYGLAAYFYSRDIGRIWRVADALETGMVGINTGIVSAATAPFGGVKQSGLGREGSSHGMDEYTEIKYLAMAY
jgi:succinate-semialdehyde dehydrogenase/glutarate-semialdehyde dehydrogenase